MTRRRLPDTRKAITRKFSVGGHEGYLTVGLYEDGQPGELFIAMAKEGSAIGGLMDSFAVVVSMALQSGVSLKALVNKLSNMRFEPCGFTGDEEIPYATSVVDYIFRWLGLKFLKKQPAPEPALTDDPPAIQSSDSLSCKDCGNLMKREGRCSTCQNCGRQEGVCG